MRYGLSEQTLTAIRRVIAQNKGVSRAILYGSRAKGTHKNGADIDLALDGATLSFDDLLRIETQLDELDLPYHFDLSIYQRLTQPDLIDHIRRVGQVLA